MAKPKKPELRVTGVATLSEELKKISTMEHLFEGGACPVAYIDDVIQMLQDLKVRKPNAVLIASKRSLYMGQLNTEKYQTAMIEFDKKLQDWKASRKQLLLKQIAELEKDDD